MGMDVPSCVAYYCKAHGQRWDVGKVADEVGRHKEGHFRELTAAGIAEFEGVRALHAEATHLGLRIAIASSGMIRASVFIFAYLLDTLI